MSFRRAPRRLLILAGLIPHMLGMWGAGGAQAIGRANPATCQDAAGGATPLVDCGGPATHLIFSVQPGDALVNQLLNPQPVVEAVDDNNIVDTNYNLLVTLTIGTNPGGGDLLGTFGLTAVAGVATYTDLSITHAGVGYTLLANGPEEDRAAVVQPADLPTTTSDPFDITQPGPAPASCNTIYGVTDARSNSRFFSVGSFPPHTLTALGGVHQGDNFEGIDIDQQGQIYASTAAANQHGQKGMLFQVDGLTGALTPAFSTGYNDVEGLAFRSGGALWAWVDGKGLLLIDVDHQSVGLAVSSTRHFEALAWNNAGDKLYLAERNKLWTWDPNTLAFSLFASNLPGPVLGMDVRPHGNLLLGVAKQQKILIWDPITKTTVGTIPTPGYKPIQSLAEYQCQQPG